MKHLLVALVLTATALGSVVLEPAEQSTAQAAAPTVPTLAPVLRPTADPVVTITIGATPARTTVLKEALDQFGTAGLLLPDLEVRFYDQADECRGHLGLFQPQYSPPRVLVCSELGFVVPHEIAHAWDEANLDDEDRARYVAAEGLETWDDPNSDREQKGVEDAAFIIQQNLMATNPPLSSPTWERRTVAYERLTGLVSPLLA